MLGRHLPWFLVASCVASSAVAASFDCRKARTAIEKLICRTPELSVADENLAKLYKKLSVTHDLGDEQRYWLSHVRTSDKPETLAACYAGRIRDMQLKERVLTRAPADALLDGCYVRMDEITRMAGDEAPKSDKVASVLCVKKEPNGRLGVQILAYSGDGKGGTFSRDAVKTKPGHYKAVAKSESGKCVVTLTVGDDAITVGASSECIGCMQDNDGLCSADGVGLDGAFPISGITENGFDNCTKAPHGETVGVMSF
jgi:uncharacterized protein